jgi:diacylglycerol O-acyltransferase
MISFEAPSHEEPLSHVDAAWLRMDCPGNPMVINGLLLFKSYVPYAEIERMVRARLLRHARFRQRVVDAGLPLRAPHWRSEPHLDLRLHLHHLRLPAPADRKAFELLLADLASTPLPRDRPLWQAYLIDDVEGGSALFVRLHHAIGDGIALVRTLLALCDGGEAEPSRVGLGERRPAPDLLALAERAAAQAATLGKLLLLPPDADSVLRGPVGGLKHLAWSAPLSLHEVKRVAVTVGDKVNDVLQSCVAGAIHRYLAERDALPSSHLRTMVTIFLSDHGSGLGNHFGLVFLDLPVQAAGALSRLKEVKRRMDTLKSAEDATVAFAVLDAVGIASPTIEHLAIEVLSRKATVLTSNVPGPSQRVELAGHAVESLLVWAPTSGYLGLSFTLLSYAGQVRLGVLADASAVEDPNAMIAAFEAEFAELAGS